MPASPSRRTHAASRLGDAHRGRRLWDAAHGRSSVYPDNAAAQGPMPRSARLSTARASCRPSCRRCCSCRACACRTTDPTAPSLTTADCSWEARATHVEIALDRCAELSPRMSSSRSRASRACPWDASRPTPTGSRATCHAPAAAPGGAPFVALPSPLPDLGGHPAIATDGSGAESALEVWSPACTAPSASRSSSTTSASTRSSRGGCRARGYREPLQGPRRRPRRGRR